jgi:short-subunit dehydrogenase
MRTHAIIGAGPGLGLAAARRFGREGSAIALVARSREHLDELTATLADDGITAGGYTADVRDADALRAALAAAAEDLGTITTLQYSPIPAKRYLRPVLETDTDDLLDALRFSVLGLAAAVEQVLPGMREAGGGTILLVNGGTSVQPKPGFAGTSVAFPAASALGQMLDAELAADGIRVRQLVVPGSIEPDHPQKNPEALADRLWDLHAQPGGFRTFAIPMDDD